MLIGYKRGQTSVVLRVKILNSSVATGAGLTGLTSASSGLKISTIADNESAATAYTVAGSTIESITTLGTYATPTATKCRFKEVDSSGHPGVYEVQIADARFAVSSAKSLLVSISGATNAAETDVVIPLRDLDPYDAVRAGLTALPNTAVTTNASLLTSGTGTDQLSVSSGKVLLQATQTGVTIPTVTTVTTTTNLTNAPTSGDFTSTMKTSLNAATPASVTGAVGSVTGNVGGNVTGSVGSVTSAVTLSAGDSPVVATGTAAAGTSTTITLASALGADSLPNGMRIKITSGTGAKQARVITGYVNSTKVVTVDRAWVTTPDATSVYAIVYDDAAKVDSSLQVTAGTVGDKTGYSLSQSFPTNFASLSIDASGRTDVGKILGTASAGAAGYVGVDWGHVNAPTTTVALTGTTIATTQQVDLLTIKTQAVTCSAGVTVNPNVGTTQPVNFTGTSTSALVKSDMVDVAGSAVSTSAAQLGVNVVNFGGSAGTFSSGIPSVNATQVAGSATAATNLKSESLAMIVSSVSDASPTASGFVGAAGLSSTDDFYTGSLLVFTSGTLEGIAEKITGFTGATKTFAFGTAFPTAPANSDTFIILGKG